MVVIFFLTTTWTMLLPKLFTSQLSTRRKAHRHVDFLRIGVAHSIFVKNSLLNITFKRLLQTLINIPLKTYGCLLVWSTKTEPLLQTPRRARHITSYWFSDERISIKYCLRAYRPQRGVSIFAVELMIYWASFQLILMQNVLISNACFPLLACREKHTTHHRLFSCQMSV